MSSSALWVGVAQGEQSRPKKADLTHTHRGQPEHSHRIYPGTGVIPPGRFLWVDVSRPRPADLSIQKKRSRTAGRRRLDELEQAYVPDRLSLLHQGGVRPAVYPSRLQSGPQVRSVQESWAFLVWSLVDLELARGLRECFPMPGMSRGSALFLRVTGPVW